MMFRFAVPLRNKKSWQPIAIIPIFIVYLFLTTTLVCLWSDAPKSNLVVDINHQANSKSLDLTDAKLPVIGPCAINLYGLPRQFKNFALPSLIENVVKPNAMYRCDYFVHFYDRREETLQRGVDQGRGGRIHPEEVYLFKDAVHVAVSDYQYSPIISYANITEVQFRQQYASLLKKLFTKRAPNGKFYYRPFNDPSYTEEVVANVIKMWHSQQAVWNLMESSPREVHYSRVAMLRLDVLYVTPIDIFQLPDGSSDANNDVAVIPSFPGIPVNDRLIYGPYDAVRLWAAGRFSRLEQHVQLPTVVKKGDGIHSEKFLFRTIFPAIEDAGIPISKHKGICLLRLRPDASIRFSDCSHTSANEYNQRVVESLIQRKCSVFQTSNSIPIKILECADHEAAKLPSHEVGVWKMEEDT